MQNFKRPLTGPRNVKNAELYPGFYCNIVQKYCATEQKTRYYIMILIWGTGNSVSNIKNRNHSFAAIIISPAASWKQFQKITTERYAPNVLYFSSIQFQI